MSSESEQEEVDEAEEELDNEEVGEEAETDEEAPELEQESDEEQEDGDEEQEDDDGAQENSQSGRTRKAGRRYDSDESYEASPAAKRKRQTPTYDGAATSTSKRPTRSATKQRAAWMDDDSEDDEPLTSSSQNVSSTRRVQVSRISRSGRTIEGWHSYRRSAGANQNSFSTQQAVARTRRQLMQDDPDDSSLQPRARRATRSQESVNEAAHSPENGSATQSQGRASRSRNNTRSQDGDSSSEDDQVLSTFAQPPSRRHARTAFPREAPQRRAPQTPTQSIEQVFVESPPARQNGSLPRTRELIRRGQAAATTHTSAGASSHGHTVTRSSSTAGAVDSSSQIELRRSAVQADHNYGEPGPSSRHSRRITQQQQLSRHQRNPDELDKPHESAESDPLRISGRLRRSPRATHSPAAHGPASDEESDDDDDDAPLVSYCETPSAGTSRAVAVSSTRSSRAQKRPYYNEDSDAEEDESSSRLKRRPTQSSSGR